MARAAFYSVEKIGPNQSLTPEGFLICADVALARTGMMIYGPDETPINAGPDGIVKIFREEKDVFDPITIASAQGKSVAIGHPDEDIVPANWKELTVGIMMNVRRGLGAMDDLLIGDLLITSPDGIKAIQSGTREVSLGYEADYEQVNEGVGKQTNIVINHIALVEQGRCGPRCAINDQKPTNLGEKVMKKNRILDALMKAFKAKDAEAVEKLAEEVADEDFGAETTGTEGETHIHIHGQNEPAEGTEGRTQFTDEDIQGHMDRNETEHAEMFARIEALEKLLAGQAEGAAATDEETKEEAELLKAEMADAVPEEMQETAAKAKDSAYFQDSFQDTIAQAEILVPGIRIPVFDQALKPIQTVKKMCGFRRSALDLAYAHPATRGILDDLLDGKPLATTGMTCDAVRTLFRSASAMKRSMNKTNPAARTGDGKVEKTGPITLAEINKRNAAKYGI